MDEIRAGLVGFGGFCKGVHLPCLRRIPDLRIAAVCDLDSARRDEARQQIGPDVRLYADLGEMLSAGGLDAVYVIVKPSAAPAIVPQVAAAGLPVFCEKPPGVTAKDARAMADACAAAGVINQVAFNRRHGPFAARMAQWMNEAGTPGRIDVRFGRTFSPSPEQITGSGIHAIDKMLSMMGPVRRVMAARATPRGGKGFGHFVAALEFASGAAGTFWLDNRMPTPIEEYHVSVVSADTLHVQLLSLYFPPPSVNRSQRSHVVRRRLDYREWDPTTGPIMDDRSEMFEMPELKDLDVLLMGGGYLGEHEAFAESLRRGRPASPTFAETVHSMEVAEAIQAGVSREF
ncbi:MAG: Inositol 2-dehydrogenase/D-chiro-inositol 3-dehydrogenase [Phycisphaerae bacterium]|nr:Inositol 2-dehydrogenase/D-chiro-inositol 3-dehydrogenase [Phycisphaerae bacterium]